MSNSKSDPSVTSDMLPEHDLSIKTGVRGKHYRAYRAGHTVQITKVDGTVETQYFTLQDGAVMLEPDVRVYFPDSDAVNQALRSLIALIPAQPAARKAVQNNR